MKTLNNYVDVATTKLFDKYNAFFAFNTAQFTEKRIEGVEYVSMPTGLICPKSKALQLLSELDAIQLNKILKKME
jgi:hypothetical protein